MEWYDRADDPWEVRDLAGAGLDEAASAPFLALDAALEAWMRDTDDLGLVVPEERMVRESMWGGADQQPATAAPSIIPLSTGGAVGFDCPTEGASIAYRFLESDGWRPFGGAPVPVPPGATRVEAVAHRIGFERSEAVTRDL